MHPLSYTQEKPSQLKTSFHEIADVRYQLFAILWVVATLFHSVKNRELDDDLSLILLSLSGLYFFYNTKSILRFVVFLLMQFTAILIYMPYVSNHWIFSGFVCLTLLTSIFILIIKSKSFQISRSELWNIFAPIIRIELIILYFFVVFHKLNYDFFDPNISCGTDLIKATMGIGFLHLPERILHMNSYATIIIETLIPLLLIFKRTRNIGVLIGLLFHNVIAYNNHNGYYDFSSMIFALYFLFTPAIFGIKIRDSFIKFLQFKKRLYQTSPEFKTSNVILFTCIAFLCLGLIIGLNRFINDYVLIFWTLFSVSYIYIYVKTLLMVYSINEQKEKQFRIEYSLLLVFPVMVFINGLSPYLGFKTENSFSMFSNLRTEGGISNHYLIPTDLQVFDYQKNLVKITSTSDPVLLEHAQKDQLITFYDLNNRVSISNPKYVNFIYKGESHEYVIGQNDHMGLKKRPSFLSRKILRFRPISNSGINNCIH